MGFPGIHTETGVRAGGDKSLGPLPSTPTHTENCYPALGELDYHGAVLPQGWTATGQSCHRAVLPQGWSISKPKTWTTEGAEIPGVRPPRSRTHVQE